MSGSGVRRMAGVMVGVAAMLATVAVAPTSALSELPRPSWRANGVVYAIAVTADRVYIGGAFTAVVNTATGQSVARSHLAALDRATGQLITTFSPTMNGQVRSMTVADNVIYAGGSFTNVNGSSHSHVVAISALTGQNVGGWNGSVNGGVRDIVATDTKVFIGGQFSRVNGQARVGLASLQRTNGSSTPGWHGGVNDGGHVFALALNPVGGNLVVGGDFTTLAGVARQFLGEVSLGSGDTTDWHPNSPCDTCFILDLATDTTSVYTAMSGAGGRVLAYTGTTGTLRWGVRADGDVQAVGVNGGTVFAGGHFGPGFDGAARDQLAAVSASNGALQSFAPSLGTTYYPGVWAIAAGDDYVRVGGGFRQVGTTRFARYAEFPR